ncbi:saccharopine dehydrogenase NADP-binding domain-containing protein [Streptomyces sp. G44]|uniref:saccharopine dehydrogenase family protein n=1 Tax=Streptomyces sp. G44 TaxID=2807632 RepID=UPI001960FF70|nr:saccharopine dehydrogenase family protein [Streptomyces sp. G44]MBM7168890.1 saccharopine dehydrogenase NADP-binding domain-containing protein [Streptomyces sp. G44]
MHDHIPATGTVHWIGAGRSTGSGLRELCDRANRVRLWHRGVERAERRLAELGLTGRAEGRAFTVQALDAELAPGDVVVSMLPPPRHAGLLRLAVARGAHFACSSYASDEMVAEAEKAAEAGVVALTEAGLDPGIDHLFAHSLVREARQKLGDNPADIRFVSYCGGVPAVPNDFRYRFSWAPRGVLNALRSPSRYWHEGRLRTTEQPWEDTVQYTIADEPFEAYPNRDSVPFLTAYALPAAWRPQTFVRGTLRLPGWRAAWEPVFAILRDGDQGRIDGLADELAARYPATADDHDRVVLAVALEVRTDDGAEWSGDYLLDVVGDDRESAMARSVSLPLACGVSDILADRTPPGLRRAAGEPDAVERWLAFLDRQGIGGGRDMVRRPPSADPET